MGPERVHWPHSEPKEKTGGDVQGGGKYGVALRTRELGSGGCDDEGSGGVPPYIFLEYCRNEILESRGVG